MSDGAAAAEAWRENADESVPFEMASELIVGAPGTASGVPDAGAETAHRPRRRSRPSNLDRVGGSVDEAGDHHRWSMRMPRRPTSRHRRGSRIR